MIQSLHLLKSYRERTGLSLQDMASLIGVDIGNLSRIEHHKSEATILILLSYHILLKIPIERLLKNHYEEVIEHCLENGIKLKEKLLDEMKSPHVDKRLNLLDIIIDRLLESKQNYDS